MAQQRTWNFGDTFTAKKAKNAQRALNLPGRYIGYDATVTDTDKITLAADGYALMPNGVLVSEDAPINIKFASMPMAATTFSITLRHSDVTTLGGSTAVYALETGELSEILSDGVVLCYVDHPGGAISLLDPSVVIRMASSQQAGATSGPASGDLGGTYPSPKVTGIQGKPVSTTAPTTFDILQYNGTQYVPTSAAAAVGVGIPAAFWHIETPVAPLVAPAPGDGNYINGFREFGVSAIIKQVNLSQEIAGTGGVFSVNLYKISGIYPYTETLVGTYSISYTQGNNGKVASNIFNPGTNILLPTDRLGIKVVSNQTGFPVLSDVTITILASNAALPPPMPSDTKAIVQALDGVAVGTTYVQVGSVRLVPGTINGTNSRFLIGTTVIDDEFTLQIRKFGSIVAIAEFSGSGFPADYSLGSDCIIFEDTFYDIFIKGGDVGTVVQIKGFKIVYDATNRRDIIQGLDSSVLGNVPTVVGALYLPAGTLQADSKFLLGTDTGLGVATLDIIRFETGTLITSIGAAGVIQVVNVSEPITIPAPGFYELYLKADSAPVTAMLTGIHLVVIP